MPSDDPSKPKPVAGAEAGAADERPARGSGVDLERLLAGVDWAATPLGPREGWPPSLSRALSVALERVAERLAAELANDRAERERERRRRLLESFALAETRFAQFMQHLPGLAWIKDLDGRYVYVNDAAEAAFRRPRAEIYGRTDDEIFPAAAAAQFREHDRRALESETGTQTLETLEHSDGGVHTSIVTKFRIPDAGGRVALLGGMAMDITDRVRAEEALEEADRRKDEFLAMLAHELRNPLASIANALQIVRRTREPGAVRSASEIMERQIGHMVRLVDDLLDVSRITRGKIELRRERVELPGGIAHCLETARRLAHERDLVLTIRLPDPPLEVDADPIRLAQVIDNLVSNAVKFTEPGGRVDLSIAREGDRAVLRVRDEGIGIDARQLPYVFDLFTQLDESPERRQGGLGIGLTVVRDLVEMHGGTVEAHSAGLGSGSEFVVRLPLRGATPQPAPAPPAAEAPLAARRILIVDDNRDAADSLALLLGLVGHVTRVAYDGRSAIEAAAEMGADTVLLDIGLPELDGYETARRIRAQPWGAGLLLIAVTGWGQAEDRERSRAAGFDAHLVKPVDHAALSKLLAERDRG